MMTLMGTGMVLGLVLGPAVVLGLVLRMMTVPAGAEAGAGARR